eukprot:Sspe_Gene.57659::Locus_31623_Transcript_1_1_Confidence_1.000_Length_1164::g.57659::m.57659
MANNNSLRLPKSLVDREYKYSKEDYTTYTGEDDWETRAPDDEEGEDEAVPEFPELVSEIDRALVEYEGEVFPTGNTCSPKDASWAISTGDMLKCTSAIDVVTLLGASPRVTTDWEASSCPVLVLRKWYSLEQGKDFRCYVVDGKLVGISQRRLSEFYPFLLAQAEEITATITKHFHEAVKGVFPESQYYYDVYLSKASQRVLGFHPLAEDEIEATLLFSGELNELLRRAQDVEPVAELRVIDCRENIVDVGVAAKLKYGIPDDLTNPALLAQAAERLDKQNGGEISAGIDELIEQMRAQAAEEAKEGS